MPKFFITILILFLLISINTKPNSIDLSDKNVVVYCLKAALRYTFEEVKEYLLRIQIPGEAAELAIDDPMYSLCLEEKAKDNL